MLTTLVAWTIAAAVVAQERPAYPQPAEGRVVVHREQEFLSSGGERFTFDLYRPAGTETVPLLIVANVGSRGYGTWQGYISLAKAFADSGMAAVIYQAAQGKAPEYYDALIGRLRDRAAEFHIDPSRVVLWAGSSNVSVGLPIAMERSRDHIRGLILYYGYGDAPQIRTDLPVFFVRAGLDSTPLNQAADRLIARALAANAPWTIENYGSGYHGFDAVEDGLLSREIVRRTIQFAGTVVRPPVTQAFAASAADAALGAAFARGEWEEVIAGYRRKTASAPGDAEAHRRLGLALTERQQYAEALTSLERAWELGRRGPRDTGFPAARAAALAGNVERSLHWLEVILKTPFGPPLDDLRKSPDFARVRSDPRFDALLTRIESDRRSPK